MSEEDPGFDRPDRAVRGTEVDEMIGTEAEWDALADAMAIGEAERNLRLAVEAKEQAMSGLTADTDDYAEVTLYDETKADMNEAVAEAAAKLVDAWAAEDTP